MQHVTVTIELTEWEATWLKHFSGVQASSRDAWGDVWAAIANATNAGLEKLGQARQAEQEREYGQPG